MSDEVTDADGLYALDPADFVAARNALVKRMKAAGEKDEAAAVAKLKRPTPGAWALNQVAREDPELVEAALAAGEELRQATDAAMDGDASGLREATAAERAASGAVVDAALAHLGAGGPQARTKVTATVHAAAIDNEVADRLQRGVLTTDEERSGLGFGFGLDNGPTAPPRPKKAASKQAPAKAKLAVVPDLDEGADEDDVEAEADAEAAAEAQAAEAEAARVERERQLAELRTEADEAQAEADRLTDEADAAADRADEAKRAAEEAKAAAGDAQDAARAARKQAAERAKALADFEAEDG